MVGGYASHKGKRVLMSNKSPQQTRGAKKVAASSIKEKRAAKRARQEPEAFIKPRKGASR